MMGLARGLYEQVISIGLKRSFDKNANLLVIDEKIDDASSSKVLADYMRKVMRQSFAYIGQSDHHALLKKIDICNQIIAMLAKETGEETLADQSIHDEAKLLLEVLDKLNNTQALTGKRSIRPVTPLVESSLFTGSAREPSLVSELKKEIITADSVDMLVSFIKWSGLRLIYEELEELTRKYSLRVITTSYMGATEVKALEMLAKLPNTQIRISYDTKRTRLHAKAYLFKRATGFSTAYIGSSNLSNAAISSGLEWNVKVTEYDALDVMRNVKATFETYWQNPEFECLEIDTYKQALVAEEKAGYTEGDQYFFDIRPYPYQQEILDRLWAERHLHNRYKNLVVAATGTGKTVMAAFDYLQFYRDNPEKSRLLFLAHREEILEQSLQCFRQILKDANFGDLCVGNHQPSQINHLFISIQSFNAKQLYEMTTDDFYDFIIIDEFHHAAAPTYQKILSYYQPKILLGLTATPERMDGQDIVSYFDGHTAVELRLFEAINRKLLSPFHYFGISDGTDLSKVAWSRRGYDLVELENVYTADMRRVNLIIQALGKYGDDFRRMIGLGFCVSVKHAHFMAEMFTRLGIHSMALDGKTADEIRVDAKRRLLAKEVQFIFAVDLFNEGVDIPEINTVLLLRPTESVTVFIQQIGRGLRLAAGKDCLAVFDFIGQCHHKFSFEEQYTALLGHTRQTLSKEIEQGFPNVPKGCYLHLEKVAQSIVLKNINEAILNQSKLIQRIKAYDEHNEPLTMENFLQRYHLTSRDIYKRGSWSRLCERAGKGSQFEDPRESELTSALGRLQLFNSPVGLTFIKYILTDHAWQLDDLSTEQSQILLMFYYTVWQKPLPDMGFASLRDAIVEIWHNPTMCKEMLDLINIMENANYLTHEKIDLGFPCSLEVHAQYTRDQILSALGYYTEERKPSQREGVLHLPEKKMDAFFITLHKSGKEYSPSTMYEDYVINERLFHWQSQSTTAEHSTAGRRYIGQRACGHQILLFVREKRKVDGFTAPYVYIGTADYQYHQGSRPMSIVWKLTVPILACFLERWNDVGS